MERISGERAGKTWARRTEESKAKILGQLSSIVQQLRAVSPPENAGVTNILGGPIFDARLPGEPFRGPFRAVDAFHESLWHVRASEVHDHMPGDLEELALFHNRASSKVVLTHGDLSSFNVLARGEDVVGIINWETARWFPQYWEYTCAWNVHPQTEYWQQEVNNFLEPAHHELRMESIRRKYFGNS
ncbi:hypothetical protein G7046_g8179 [Stylonectria norvegica]|nr:hypothetical protein G7046_g8179 [Stylonectria norvegica]